MTREDLDFIGSMNMCDEISNEAYKKIVCHCEEQEPILDKIRAELHATAEMHEDGAYYLRDEWIDEYFDKYKAESEDKE